MFGKPLLRGDFPNGQLVGAVDIDPQRSKAFLESENIDLPVVTPDRLSDLIQTSKATHLVVTSPDHTHVEYAKAALEHGLDAICEKPVVTDCRQGERLLQAQSQSAGEVIVAHNYRYMPLHTRIKQVLRTGIIGRVTQVNMDYLLDTYHGASYFYRWNRLRECSGGLSVHKSSHHFDLLNWWLEATPTDVFAFGARNYYGPGSPHRPAGDLSVSAQKKACPYYQKWFSQSEAALQDDHLPPAWQKDGISLSYPMQYPRPLYIYDEEINVEDTYSAVIRYNTGASACYSVVFSSVWEGYTLGISGTHGRLEVRYCTAPNRSSLPVSKEVELRVCPLFGAPVTEIVEVKSGGHGGADAILREDLFGEPSPLSRELDRVPSLRDGLLAVAVGEAVWRSTVQNRVIPISELFPPSRKALTASP